MIKKLLISVLPLFFCFTTLLDADEFWLQPSRFLFSPRESVEIKFVRGDSLSNSNWNGNRGSIDQLHLYYNDEEDALENYVSETSYGDSLNLQFYDSGTVVISFLSKASPVSNENGIKTSGKMIDDSVSGNLSSSDLKADSVFQSVKTILQVGSTLHPVCSRKTTLPVDIVPNDHLYQLIKEDSLEFTVYFKGNPLANHPLRIYHESKGIQESSIIITDQDGRARFPVDPIGFWRISTTCFEIRDSTDKPEKDPSAPPVQWQGSLTWGYSR